MDTFAIAWVVALCRSASLFLAVQLPSARRAPAAARILLAALLASLIAPLWEVKISEFVQSQAGGISSFQFFCFAWRELLTGLCFGLAWSAILEVYSFGMQMLSIQAGFSYASMIDPTSEADSGLLLVIGQFISLLTLLSLGFHLEFLRAIVSVEPDFSAPNPISVAIAAELAIRLLREVSLFALRISLPLISFLVVVDIVFVLLGKFNEKLQLISLSLGLKTLAALLLIAACIPSFSNMSGAAARKIERQWTAEVLQLVR